MNGCCQSSCRVYYSYIIYGWWANLHPRPLLMTADDEVTQYDEGMLSKSRMTMNMKWLVWCKDAVNVRAEDHQCQQYDAACC